MNSTTPKPIEIFVSYAWTKEVPIRQDERWKFLRGLIAKVVSECEARVRQSPGEYKPHIRINRLRGRLGMNLLSTLRDRIQRADALVIDIGENNSNVLIEVGIALAMRKSESGALFIVKPTTLRWPSNLQGIMYCNYDESLQKGLEDRAGFGAALRTQILNVARERGMLGSPRSFLLEIEGEEASAKVKNTVGQKSPTKKHGASGH
jgi:hypothetical protein